VDIESYILRTGLRGTARKCIFLYMYKRYRHKNVVSWQRCIRHMGVASSKQGILKITMRELGGMGTQPSRWSRSAGNIPSHLNLSERPR